MLFFLLSFTFFNGLVVGEHFTVTYHFWERNPKIAEKAEFYTKYAANSNRFWTSNLEFEQHDDDHKMEKIQISSANWKSANIEEEIDEHVNLDLFFERIFQKFADKLYTNLALHSIPVFDRSIFTVNRHAFEDYEDLGTDNLWNQLPENHEQKYHYVLLAQRSSFEDYEAVLKFTDAIKRTNLPGTIVDCEKNEKTCNFNNEQYVKPFLVALGDDGKFQVFEKEFQKDHVHDWMLTIQQAIITPLNENLMPQYRSGIVPGFKEPRDTVVILFIPDKKSIIWKNFHKFARENFGKYHLGSLVNKEVEKWSIYPAFITMKPYDAHVKAFTLYQDITYERMAEYIEDSTHPSVHNLQTPSDLLFAMEPRKPLLIFFDPSNSKNLTEFTFFAANEQGTVRLAHFGSILNFDLFGMYLMNVFNIDPTPQYVMVSRKEKSWCVFSRPIGDRDFLKMKNWMANNLKLGSCQEEIEDFKFPIHRLHLLERYDDVEELERELTQVHRVRDEF